LLKRGKTIGAELTFSDHVGGFYSRDGCGGGMKGLEAKHRAGDPLDEAMVLLQDIVQAFDLPDVDGTPDAGEFQDHVTACRPARVAPLLSTTTRSGTPFELIARLKKRRAAAVSRRSGVMTRRNLLSLSR
jgi:hypothetical protein